MASRSPPRRRAAVSRTGSASVRPRGRPPGGGDTVRRQLLDTATRLFSRRGYAEVSIREIARAARVTPAMIAYHFGSKLGLWEAMLDEVYQRLFGQVQELASQPARDDTDPIRAFVELYFAAIGDAPWIPQFVVREIITRDGPLRRRFIEQYARRLAAVAPPLLVREMRAGRLRGDLDPVLGLISLIGLCVFPFLAAPVLEPALGIKLDREAAPQLIEHTARLFVEGAGARGDSR